MPPETSITFGREGREQNRTTVSFDLCIRRMETESIEGSPPNPSESRYQGHPGLHLYWSLLTRREFSTGSQELFGEN